MNWYKNIIKISSSSYAIPIKYIVNRHTSRKIDITFIMQRPGGTFRLITKEPVSDSFLQGDISSIFLKLKENKMLTTPQARRTKDNQIKELERKELERKELENKVKEQTLDDGEVKNSPEQLEFNFSSNRSRLFYKKSNLF